MRKWIWTFGSKTKYGGKYVIVCRPEGEGDGQSNCSMLYLFDKGMELAKRYNWECMGVMI